MIRTHDDAGARQRTGETSTWDTGWHRRTHRNASPPNCQPVRPNVGTAELMPFYTHRDRFPELDAHGIAVVLTLMMYVNTSGRGGTRYVCYPSHKTLAAAARVTEPTVRRALQQLEATGWLLVTKRRAGKRNAPNLYSVSPAVDAILAGRRAQRPALVIIQGAARHDT
jgi:hypothetical protein